MTDQYLLCQNTKDPNLYSAVYFHSCYDGKLITFSYVLQNNKDYFWEVTFPQLLFLST